MPVAYHAVDLVRVPGGRLGWGLWPANGHGKEAKRNVPCHQRHSVHDIMMANDPHPQLIYLNTIEQIRQVFFHIVVDDAALLIISLTNHAVKAPLEAQNMSWEKTKRPS